MSEASVGQWLTNWLERYRLTTVKQMSRKDIEAALDDYAREDRQREMDERGLDEAVLAIRAEQLTTAYELAKDEGLRGDELNAVVVRHLDGLAWVTFRMFIDALKKYLTEHTEQEPQP